MNLLCNEIGFLIALSKHWLNCSWKQDYLHPMQYNVRLICLQFCATKILTLVILVSTAAIQWNEPSIILKPDSGSYQNIVLKYPLGQWWGNPEMQNPATEHNFEIGSCSSGYSMVVAIPGPIFSASTLHLALKLSQPLCHGFRGKVKLKWNEEYGSIWPQGAKKLFRSSFMVLLSNSKLLKL